MREPVQIVEMDVDYCSLSYGTGNCTAVLGTTGVRKCYNMFRHCQDQENFDKTTLTLRFAQPRANMPMDQVYFPCLDVATPRSSTVNIGGADNRFDALGKRATVTVRLNDFAYDDFVLDKYQPQRVSGVAQTDEGGYNPRDRGTFFRKLKTRWPYYAGRSLRVIDAYIEGGTLVQAKTRHFVMTEMAMDDSGRVTISGKDVLNLAENKRATCPAQSTGVLVLPISDSATTATLTPAGIGDLEYPANGKVAIGSEIVAFTRSGDVMTLTRGQNNTAATSHNESDAVQLCYEVNRARLDDTVRGLLVDYAGIDAAFIPMTDWQAEVTRWASGLELSTLIPKPEGVAGLVGELAVLGVNIWWDDVAQEIRLKMIRPPDGDTVFDVTDDTAIKSAEIEDRDEDRLTRVAFFSAQINPTKSVTSADNFRQQYLYIDLLSESDLQYNGSLTRSIYCRWLNTGDDINVRIAALRLLLRLKDAPQRLKMRLDAKDADIGLTDVLNVNSGVYSDETGAARTQLMQVVSIADHRSGHDFDIVAQNYAYSGQYIYIAPDDAPDYSDATDAEKAAYWYFSDGDNNFPDNRKPYEII